VEITILKDPDKPATKDNTEKKEFPAIETFTSSGATTVIVLKRLQTEVFEHLGISNDNTKVADRLDYLLQVTTGCESRPWQTFTLSKDDNETFELNANEWSYYLKESMKRINKLCMAS
jgi:hypothetical protein